MCYKFKMHTGFQTVQKKKVKYQIDSFYIAYIL